MPDFNALKPEKNITDPKNLGTAGEYPRHVHKWAGTDEKGNVLLNDFKVVASDEEKAAALAEGWSLQPVLEDPGKPKKEAKADKGK